MNEYEEKLFKYIDNGNLFEIKKLFIEHRDEVDINVKTEDTNETPLFRAVRLNNLDIVRFLLTDQNIDINTLNFYNKTTLGDISYALTPLMWAVSKENTDMVRVLLSYKEININLVPSRLKNLGFSYFINRILDINKRTKIVKLLLAREDLIREIIENIRDLDEMTKLDPEIGILLATLNVKINIEDKSESESYKQRNCLLV